MTAAFMSASDVTPSKNIDVIPLLSQWLGQQLALPRAPELKPLGGDAGFRCYYRFADKIEIEGQPLIAVYAPPEVEKNHEFVAIGEYFGHLEVRTPKVFAVDLEQGFFLLEDLGAQHLFDVLCPENVAELYALAGEQLIMLQSGVEPASISHNIPHYDHTLLMAEMGLFEEWFLPQLLSYKTHSEERSLISTTMSLFAASAEQQPYRLVHRDFHSRNIMLTSQGLALIDFQDAVWGPISYDLVSLIRDCYVYWPADVVANSLRAHWQAMPAQLQAGMSFDAFQKAFDWMGLQRHIKVLGIFARLSLRDGKTAYLDDLPLVVRYVIEVAEKYPELADFSDWFRSQLIPLCEQQSWYENYRTAGEKGKHLERTLVPLNLDMGELS